MTAEDLIAGLMAAVSAGILTAHAILASPAVRSVYLRLRRAP